MATQNLQTVALPEIIDLDSIDGIRDQLIDALEEGPVTVQASAVERVSTNALLLLISAVVSIVWSEPSHSHVSVPLNMLSALLISMACMMDACHCTKLEHRVTLIIQGIGLMFCAVFNLFFWPSCVVFTMNTEVSVSSSEEQFAVFEKSDILFTCYNSAICILAWPIVLSFSDTGHSFMYMVTFAQVRASVSVSVRAR